MFIRRSLERSCVVFILFWFRLSWSAVLDFLVLPSFCFVLSCVEQDHLRTHKEPSSNLYSFCSTINQWIPENLIIFDAAKSDIWIITPFISFFFFLSLSSILFSILQHNDATIGIILNAFVNKVCYINLFVNFFILDFMLIYYNF